MDTPTSEPQHIQSIPVKKRNGGDFLRNDANCSACPHKASLDLLRKQFHLSIDINKTPQLELDDQQNFSVGHESNFKVESAEEERSITQAKISENDNCLGSNLKLKSKRLRPSYGSTSEAELPPLIVMGCTRCHIYVLASKASPECPKCKNDVLIDQFQGTPTCHVNNHQEEEEASTSAEEQPSTASC